MGKEKIHLTLENFFPQDISNEIIEYLKSKNVKEVKLVLMEEKEKPIEQIYLKKDFKKLKEKIKNSLCSDGLNFFIEAPEIQSSWEEFTYGIDAISNQKDFKKTFSKYE
jgi:predicted nucleotidyltransferase